MFKVKLTIRTSLLAVTALLSIGVIVLSGLESLRSWTDVQQSARVEKSNRTADLLLTAAGSWAVERGVTNAALANWNPADDTVIAAIAERRRTADTAFATALADIEADEPFAGRDARLSAVREAHAKLVALRSGVDADLKQMKPGRSVEVAKTWVATATALIMESQDLRIAAQYLPQTITTRIFLAQDVKHAVWTMSEYAGRERAIVGGLVVAGSAMTPEVQQRLSELRGRVMQAWSGVDAYLAKEVAAPEIRAAAEQVKSAFFGRFQAVREKVYAAGEKGPVYPIDGPTWIKEATAGIDSLLGLERAASDASMRLAQQSKSDSWGSLMVQGSVLVAATLLTALAFWIVLRRVVRPIRWLTAGMRDLAAGNLDVVLPGGGHDEIGDMSQAVEVFRENAREVRRLEAEQKRSAELAEAEKRRAMTELADAFEASVNEVVGAVAQAAEELQATAGSMSATAEEANAQAVAVASAAGQASSNVQTVATASEELAASISEIGRQAGESRRIATDAAEKAETTNRQVEGLVEAARRIGDVIAMIQGIAAQTNLLALNATIEAARAGESGKGFAVVAGEVKSLANQVAKATDEISEQIASIQLATGEAAGSIQSIAKTIAEVNESAASIAAAVEQQNAATTEISRNVQEAATGTEAVSQNTEGLSAAARDTGAAAAQVLQASGGLARDAQRLTGEVQGFIERIRSA